jgi:hypothetical protein
MHFNIRFLSALSMLLIIVRRVSDKRYICAGSQGDSQSRNSSNGSEQKPIAKNFTLYARNRTCVPAPQTDEQALHSDHGNVIQRVSLPSSK